MELLRNKRTGKALAIALALILLMAYTPMCASASSSLSEPEGVYASVAASRVSIHWTKVPGAKYYQVRMGRDGSSKWKVFPKTRALSYKPTVPNNDLRLFQVRAYAGGRYSDWSEAVFASKADKITLTGDSEMTDTLGGFYQASLPDYYDNGDQEFRWYINGQLISDAYSKNKACSFPTGTNTLEVYARNGMHAKMTVKCEIKMSGGKFFTEFGYACSNDYLINNSKYDAAVRKQLTIGGQDVYIGEPEADVEATFGSNYVTKASGTDYVWHIYNAESNQGQMLFAGIKAGKVQALYTNAIGWAYKDSIYSFSDGYEGYYDGYMTDKRNDSGAYITMYGDKYNSGRVYGIKIEKTADRYLTYQDYSKAKGVDLIGMPTAEQQAALEDFADEEIYLVNSMRVRANNVNYVNVSNRNMLVKDAVNMGYAEEWAGILAERNGYISHSGGYNRGENVAYNSYAIMDPISALNQFYEEISSETTGHRNNILLQLQANYPTKMGCSFKISASNNIYVVEEFN